MLPVSEAVPRDGGRPRTTGGPPVPAAEGTGTARAGGGLLRKGRRSLRLRAAAVAALLSAVLFCLAGATAGSRPFGTTTRNTVDLGTQYLAYHTHWRKLLLGRADGDMFMNWSAGHGSNFLGDFGTYLSSPFALLVVLFPEDRIETALYVATVAKIAAAGAAMAVLLLGLRRGPWPVAAVLGAAYALSGWTFNYSATVPMWLDGLLAFPLLCLVGEWARAGRRPVLGPLVVGLFWVANFYTAYMATLGAAVVLTIRLFTGDGTARRRLAGLLRAARTVALGIGLAAPVVLVVHAATRSADPTPEVTFAAVGWGEVLTRLLPATSGVATPALFIGTPALALALTLPFNRVPAPRVRIVWTAAVCLVALSLQWEPTHLLWHAGASPNGIPYRQTFVLCGLLVMAGWLSVAQGVPRWPASAGAGVLLAVVAFTARDSALVDRWTYPAFATAGALAFTAAAAVLLRNRHTAKGRVAPAVAVTLLLVAQAGESVVTGARIERQQVEQVSWSPALGPWHTDMARAVREEDAWPAHRTDPGDVPGGNDPMLVGGQGAEYYSSLTSEVHSSTLSALGFAHYAKGRRPVGLDNPVTDAIFSVGTRMRSTPKAPPRVDVLPEATITVTSTAVPPLVTVRPDAGPARAPVRFGESAFANQEVLLGAQVYELPADLALTEGAGGSTVLTAGCPAGSQVFLCAPRFQGTAALAGEPPVGFFGKPPAVQAAMQDLGTVPASGSVRVELRPHGGAGSGASAGRDLPEQPVGCLEADRLAEAVNHLTATGATRVRVSGHTLSAELPASSTGTAVVAVPRISGWRCAAGDDAGLRPADRYLGLLAVPLDGSASSIHCTFRPPGLRLGAAVAAVSLLLLTAVGFLHGRSRGTRL